MEPIRDAIAEGRLDQYSSPVEATSAFNGTIKEGSADAPTPRLSLDELRERLSKIDWLRYRKQWVVLNGAKIDKKTGKPKRIELKTGEDVISSQAQNTNANIDAVAAKILSSAWTDLQSHENA